MYVKFAVSMETEDETNVMYVCYALRKAAMDSDASANVAISKVIGENLKITVTNTFNSQPPISTVSLDPVMTPRIFGNYDDCHEMNDVINILSINSKLRKHEY
jgi:hypothetical protein